MRAPAAIEQRAMIGRNIDRYVVLEKLGEGGMGVVYKARDTLLDRLVALKVLPADRRDDDDRRRRFLREAKSASALNHPGIVSVHDVLRVDGQDVIVMELVEGETLADILHRRRPHLGTALDYTIAIADALARAHAAGIVHRDLKPANVMVTRDGRIKILDFGLAKLVEPGQPDEDAPTMTRDREMLTATRTVVGTLGYMSPEQASGERVDARSDVFSFGVIAYELLTGEHPFRHASRRKTMESIVDPHPEPLSDRVATLPTEVDRAILRCLNKNPGDRWQNLSDLKVVLQDIKQDSESGRTVVIERTRRPPRSWPWLVGGVAVVLLAAAAVIIVRPWGGHVDDSPLTLSRLTYDGGLSGLPAISQDGKLIAYASDRGGDDQLDLWLRHVNQPGPAQVTRHPADDWMPSFSPDGSRIAYRSSRDGGGIYIVNALGGQERRLAGTGIIPRFSPDGSWISFMDYPDWSPVSLRRMWMVSPEGGPPRPVAPGFGTFAPPGSIGGVWSPDGTRMLFAGARFDDPSGTDWWVVSLDGGEPVSSGVHEAIPRIDVVQFPVAWRPGQLLFVAGTTIEGLNVYSVRISSEGRISGRYRALTTGPGMTWMPTVSQDGRIALSRIEWLVNLWQVEVDPNTGRAVGDPRMISTSPAPKLSFAVSRDGALLAFSVYSGPVAQRRADVRIRDLATGQESLAVSLPAQVTSLRPVLSADGSMLSWADVVDGRRVAVIAPIDEPSEPRALCEDCRVFGLDANGTGAIVRFGLRRIDHLDLDDGSTTTLLELDDGAVIDADPSWDDRWLAVLIGRPDGRVALSVVPIAGASTPREDWIEITDGQHWVGSPRWSHDGRVLYHLSERDDFVCVWAQPVDGSTKRPRGDPFAVVHGHGSSMNMRTPQRLFTLGAARDRILFNAGEISSEVYTAVLDGRSD